MSSTLHNDPSPALAELTETARRRWWLGKWAWTIAAILLAAILTPLAMRGYYLRQIPYIDEPAEIAALRHATISPEDNALTLYTQAVAKLAPDHVPRELWQAAYKAEWQWSAVPDAVKDYLARNEDALDLWRQGTEVSAFAPVSPSDADLESIPTLAGHLWAFRRMVFVKMHQQLALADGRSAWNWVAAHLRCMNQSKRSIGTIGYAYHISRDQSDIVLAQQWCRSAKVTRDDLLAALAECRSISSGALPHSVRLAHEYLIRSNTLQRSDWDQFLHPKGVRHRPPKALLYALGEPDYSQMLLRHVYLNTVTYCDLPRWQRPPLYPRRAMSSRFFELASVDQHRLISPAALLHSDGGAPSKLWFVHSLGACALDDADCERASQLLLEVTFAAQAYYRDFQRFPDTLAELVPDYLDSVPLDPLSPGPEPVLLAYRRTTDGAVAYSLGDNETDDGGLVEAKSGKPADWGWTLQKPVPPTD